MREWGIGDYGEKKLKVGGERDPIWMRAGRDILRAGSANAQATELEDVIIFRRDDDGLLREQIMAKTRGAQPRPLAAVGRASSTIATIFRRTASTI